MDICVVKKEEIVWEKIDFGNDDDFRLMDIIAKPQGSPYTFGINELGVCKKSSVEYDNDSGTCYILEGELILEENTTGSRVTLTPGDTVYIPKKAGLVVDFICNDYCKYVFVTFPNWR